MNSWVPSRSWHKTPTTNRGDNNRDNALQPATWEIWNSWHLLPLPISKPQPGQLITNCFLYLGGVCKCTVPLQNTLRQMQCVDILKYTTTWGLALAYPRARPETLCLCVMLALTANLTESKITLPLGDYLDCTNWGGKTCLLRAAPFPRLHKWLFSASRSWMWLTSCFQCAFDSLAITDFTVELKGEVNPFSIELLLSGYFSTSAGEGTKILGKPAYKCLCVCRCTCVLGRCEHVWACVEAKRHLQVSFPKCYLPCLAGSTSHWPGNHWVS